MSRPRKQKSYDDPCEKCGKNCVLFICVRVNGQFLDLCGSCHAKEFPDRRGGYPPPPEK